MAEDKEKKQAPNESEKPEVEAAETAAPAEKTESEDERYVRLFADYQNFKRRVEKEKQDIYAFGNEKICTDILGVVDNFERALAAESTDKAFKDGMEMIFKQLMATLERAGVKEIPALGEEFDPNFHQAMAMVDSEEYESGKVAFVMQKGYTLNDRVIRPAMVNVAK